MGDCIVHNVREYLNEEGYLYLNYYETIFFWLFNATTDLRSLAHISIGFIDNTET